MKFSLGVLMLGPLAAMAQSSNLDAGCNGDRPDSVTEALPFLGLSGEVPQFCFQVAGRERCFYVMVPEGTTGEVPLVFDIHGSGSCPILSILYTGWFQLAQANKFVIVWPLGVTDALITDDACFAMPGGLPFDNFTSPSCCCVEPGTLYDVIDADFLSATIDADVTKDADFLRMAIEEVMANVGPLTEGSVSINPKKVFMAGHSNGCVASLSMAAMHSDLVTGVACHSGKSVTPFAEDYIPVPTFIVHGAKDDDFLYAELNVADGIGLSSTPDQFKAIADRNGCAEDVLATMLPDGEGQVETRTGCTNDADVTLVTLANAGHNPFLGVDSPDPGSSPTTIDTSQLAWNFLSMIGEPAAATEAPAALTEAPATATEASVAPTAAPNDTSSAVVVKAYIATTMVFLLVGILS
jgi:poly(3-hydroxybutyrate) depolymerase